MTDENIRIVEDENGTFLFQCSNCKKQKRMRSPNRLNFKVKCPCGTKTAMKLNARENYRRPVNIPIKIISPKFRASGITADISAHGISGSYSGRHELEVGDQVKIEYTFKLASGEVPVTEHATIKYVNGDNFGAVCEDLPQYSEARKQKGFFVMPPDETLWLKLE
ncbi:MAG: PilZ domain-containing protein [Desulfobacteraceae bacterium]|nr:PilZ domain-containing protein [Desulfobacteraceae bacterium]